VRVQTRYDGRPALALTVLGLLLSSCSSDEPTSRIASPTPGATAVATPTPSSRPSAAATRAPSASARPSPTPSPTRSPAASPSPTRSRRPSASPRPSPTPSPTRKGVTYAISQQPGDLFDPDQVSLRAGDSVRVSNDDSGDHDFAVRALDVSSGNMPPGDTFTYRFTKAGTYDFVCEQHEALGMSGTVTVRS